MPYVVRWVVVVESALAAVALLAGRLLGADPTQLLVWGWPALGLGLAATLPPAVGMWWIDRSPWPPFRRLRTEIDRRVRPLFAPCSLVHCVIIGAFAALGEELLFRGLVQAGIGTLATPAIGLVVATALFAALHALTPTYAVLAAIMGAYLGWLLLVTDTLVVPMIVHALYDVTALAWWIRRAPAAEPTSDG